MPTPEQIEKAKEAIEQTKPILPPKDTTLKETILKQERLEQPLDWKKAEEHLANIRRYVLTFAGKKGYNPYLWVRNNLVSLEQELEKGDKTSSLYNKIMALKQEEPTVNTKTKLIL